MILEDLNNRLKALQTHYSYSPEKLIDRIVLSYYKKILNELTTMLNGTHVDRRDKAIEAFLKMNWDRINGTCLSYTALPDSDVTDLLCDLANMLPKKGSKGVVSYLMPTVSTDSIRTPHYPHLGPIQDVYSDEWSADPVDDVQFLLKTHVLGREGKYLIPIQLLIDDEIDTQFNNVYFDTYNHRESMQKIDTEEWRRLHQHGPLTKALHEAIAQGELLSKEKNHLLGHLTTLINQLQFNSVSGVGEELTAGEGAYRAIVQFHRYYEVLEAPEKNRIPQALIHALDTLFLLASDPAANTAATGTLSIDTCIAIRRTDILNALRGHEVLLADIGLTGIQKSELIAQNQRQITGLKSELKTQIIQKKQVNGHDSLGITHALLQTFNCPINLKTPEDVADLVCHLSPNEITELCGDDLIRNKIVTVIKNLENLIILYMQLSPERLVALNLAISETLTKNIIQSGNQLIMVLGLFDAEKKRLMIESFMPLKTANGFELYAMGLFSNLELDVFEVMRESLLGMIKTPDDFVRILQYLTPEQRTPVYTAIETRLPDMIKTSVDFKNILQYLSPEQYATVYTAMGTRLPDMIKTSDDFKNILQYLSPEQRTAVYTAMEARLPDMIKKPDDFVRILSYLSSEQSTAVYTAMGTRLPDMIKTSDDFENTLQYLSLEQRTAVYTAMGTRLPDMIKTSDDFVRILRYLLPEQCTTVYMDAHLTGVIQGIYTYSSILKLFPLLRLEQRAAVFTAMAAHLPSLIQTDEDFYIIQQSLSPEERTVVYKAMEAQLPGMIQKMYPLHITG